MAKRKSPSGQRLKKIRHDLAQLKKAGLWTGDARSAKGGWRQVKTINTFQDVLAGKAKAVKVSRSKSKELPKASRDNVGSLRVKGTRMIVPLKDKNERFHVSKDGDITSVVTRYGRKFRRHLFGKTYTKVDDLPDPPKGKTWYYGLVSKNGGGLRFQDKAELRAFLNEYKENQHKEAHLVKFLEVLEPLEDMEDDDGEGYYINAA